MRELRSATMWSQRVNVLMCECVSVLYKCVNVLMRECALRMRKYVIFRIEYDFFTYILYIFRRIITNRNGLIIRSLFIICVKMCIFITFSIRKMCIFASENNIKMCK